LEGFLKGPANRHSFAHRLHGSGQTIFGIREFLKGPSGHLDHTVINGRFKRGKGLAGNVVGNLIQRITNGEFGGYLGNGKSRGLGCQCRASRYPRIHLNDHHLPVFRVNCKLDIGAASFHADFPDDSNGCVAHDLIFPVCQGLGRSHSDTVTRVNAHGVKVLNGADNDNIVFEVPHDLKFILLPPDERFFHDNLGNHTDINPFIGKVFHLFPVIGHTAPGPSHCKTGPDDERITKLFCHFSCLGHVSCDPALSDPQADVAHGIPELLTILGL